MPKHPKQARREKEARSRELENWVHQFYGHRKTSVERIRPFWAVVRELARKGWIARQSGKVGRFSITPRGKVQIWDLHGYEKPWSQLPIPDKRNVAAILIRAYLQEMRSEKIKPRLRSPIKGLDLPIEEAFQEVRGRLLLEAIKVKHICKSARDVLLDKDPDKFREERERVERFRNYVTILKGVAKGIEGGKFKL